MILDESTAHKTAELLLQINAIKLNPQEPFIWASGLKSPIYCDNRIILSYPPIRNFIVSELAKSIETLFGKPDIIAGVATGAIGVGAIIADYLGLPFVYVRPEPKKHGRKNQIEGKLDPHANVVVIEDLISTGKSSLNAIKALKEEGQANIKGMMAIFTYGFNEAETRFKEEHIDVYTLGNYDILLEEAYKTNYLNKKELELLKTWREDPANWNT
ncbi:orotate phosphoribosyltransferase PyrE [Psychroflexus torquis ATCC 700755]|uniref:Orotate phosphoribosyltransferase n=1 Tax=Psychroflexus torquis (strain ATCC 700755 / CIP 106069 / ACAM 623) TaxID=313595 RepID=K4INN4_PSYTT|nr:orotate phosphoribosyltransferase [Psychroflexus torquis]AFU67160.1 orotate phosphoribosyltransferase PyrE [Psychroflexus torquis ATCC 700755]